MLRIHLFLPAAVVVRLHRRQAHRSRQHVRDEPEEALTELSKRLTKRAGAPFGRAELALGDGPAVARRYHQATWWLAGRLEQIPGGLFAGLMYNFFTFRAGSASPAEPMRFSIRMRTRHVSKSLAGLQGIPLRCLRMFEHTGPSNGLNEQLSVWR